MPGAALYFLALCVYVALALVLLGIATWAVFNCGVPIRMVGLNMRDPLPSERVQHHCKNF